MLSCIFSEVKDFYRCFFCVCVSYVSYCVGEIFVNAQRPTCQDQQWRSSGCSQKSKHSCKQSRTDLKQQRSYIELLWHMAQCAGAKLHKMLCNISACARPCAYQCSAVWTRMRWVGARAESRAFGCHRVTHAGFPQSGSEQDACRNRPPAVSFYGFCRERSSAVW